jgi:hypothetical protein
MSWINPEKIKRREVKNYRQQMLAAAESEQAHIRDLIVAGWKYDEATRQWTHPDRPGTTISL